MAEHLIDALTYPPIQRAAIACVLCGASCSLLSVFVVLMKMPLIGVSMSHAAFAGAVLGLLLDFNPFLSGFILCLLVAGVLGPLSDRTDMAPENVLGIMFSFLMGLAFLGMGILTRTKAGALNLMWGSLLSLSGSDIVVLTLITSVLVLFVLLFFKEIRSVLFNRRLAAASGVPERIDLLCASVSHRGRGVVQPCDGGWPAHLRIARATRSHSAPVDVQFETLFSHFRGFGDRRLRFRSHRILYF